MTEELSREELLDIIKPIHEGMMFAQAHTKHKRSKEAIDNLETQSQGLWQIRKLIKDSEQGDLSPIDAQDTKGVDEMLKEIDVAIEDVTYKDEWIEVDYGQDAPYRAFECLRKCRDAIKQLLSQKRRVTRDKLKQFIIYVFHEKQDVDWGVANKSKATANRNIENKFQELFNVEIVEK